VTCRVLRCDEVTPNTPVADLVPLLRDGPPGPWPDGWASWDNVHLAHKELFRDHLATLPPYPDGRWSGRGIVSAVTAKPGWTSGKYLEHGYLPAAYVMVKELRRLGCTLPVTFCHLGPAEWCPSLTKLVEPLGVDVIDLFEWERTDRFRILSGFESKVAAVYASRYEEVLFLDADNVPVRNPEFLFASEGYRAAGSVFWVDLSPVDRPDWLPPVVWDALNIPYDPTHAPDFESGQFVIDKRRAWKGLSAARWINEHSDRYYAVVFGDKSTFRLGWAATGTPYVTPPVSPGWNGAAILQYGTDGRLLFEHCVQNKPSLRGYPRQGCLTHPGEANGHLAELRALWDGTIWGESPSADDAAKVATLVNRKFLYTRKLPAGDDRRVVRLLDDGRVGRGAAAREFGWSVHDGKLAVTGFDGELTMILDELPDGSWTGKWQRYERCPVTLTPE
jgi:hypothetical protein